MKGSYYEAPAVRPTIGSLNHIAGEYPGGDMHVHKIIKSTDGRYAVQWRIIFGDDPAVDSWMLFINHGGFCETKQAAIIKELDELKERITMDIFGTELFPYLQGEMFGGKDVTMTIKAVKIEEVVNDRGKEKKPTVYFKERPKGLILNKTNAKAIARLYGRETNDWIGKTITMYAEAGTWFGKPGFAVRVRDSKSPKTNGKAPTNIPFEDDNLDEDEALAELIFNDQEQAELFAE